MANQFSLNQPDFSQQDNRRTSPRIGMDRPVKLRCTLSGRTFPARTTNLSSGGVLVQITQSSNLLVGQGIEVGIAWTARQMLLSDKDMIPGTVVRNLGLEDKRHVAVEFDFQQKMARSA